MAHSISKAVIKHGPKDQGQFLALLSLAEASNSNGNCSPTIADLTDTARTSERSLKRHLSQLEKLGWIRRQRKRTEKGTLTNYDYEIVLTRLLNSHQSQL